MAGIGEVGEIAIRTPHLSRGCLSDAELTAARFVANPWTGDAADRMYHTGDLGRYRPDGAVEIAGRTDAQMKVRGRGWTGTGCAGRHEGVGCHARRRMGIQRPQQPSTGRDSFPREARSGLINMDPTKNPQAALAQRPGDHGPTRIRTWDQGIMSPLL